MIVLAYHGWHPEHNTHFRAPVHFRTCHFDLTQNLNKCEKKSEYTEKNLNLTTKIARLSRNLYEIQSQKKSEC